MSLRQDFEILMEDRSESIEQSFMLLVFMGNHFGGWPGCVQERLWDPLP